MKTTSRHLLLISYVFPPYPGIGGRRWAKFSKELTRKGYVVHVLHAENIFPETSRWNRDIENNPAIFPAKIPSGYPSILLQDVQSFSKKLHYKIALAYVRLCTKGNPYERAAFWKDKLLTAAEEIIRMHGIRNIITTGAPFHALHHALELKNRFQGLNIISDFRDQWTDNQSFGGYRGLSELRLEYEQKLEKDVLQNSDWILSVSEKMTDNLQNRAGKTSSRFMTLHNGYDPEDLVSVKNSEKKIDAPIRFAFAGTLYDSLENVFLPFIEGVSELKEKRPAVYVRLAFDFYGHVGKNYQSEIKKKNLDNIRVTPNLPLDDLMRSVSGADFFMLFLNDDHTFTRSTKFAEYVGMRKKIAVFSHPGELASFVEKNRIGYACNPQDTFSDILRIVQEFDNGGGEFNPAFVSESFSTPILTHELEKIFVF